MYPSGWSKNTIPKGLVKYVLPFSNTSPVVGMNNTSLLDRSDFLINAAETTDAPISPLTNFPIEGSKLYRVKSSALSIAFLLLVYISLSAGS